MTWFEEKFIAAHCHYYTIESTLTYGIILVFAAWMIYKLLLKLNIKIDKQFLISLIPFIIYGGWARALRDHGLGFYSDAWWWCTPFIYLIIFAVTIGSLLAALKIEKKFKIPYHKTMITIGSVLIIYNILFTRITNWLGATIILALLAGWFALFYGIHKLWPKKMSFENAMIIVAHLFDGSATFSALTFFGDIYTEQHVLPNFLINMSGPWIMFPLKIFVVWGVLHLVDKNIDSVYLRNLMKIIILILGLAPGIRDFLTLAML